MIGLSWNRPSESASRVYTTVMAMDDAAAVQAHVKFLGGSSGSRDGARFGCIFEFVHLLMVGSYLQLILYLNF